MDSRDVALQTIAPTVMVPLFSTFEPLQSPGHRFLAAANGLWLEVFRPWLYLRYPVANQTAVAMPYGEVTPEMRFAFGKLPLRPVFEFIEVARQRSPIECAAWVIWNETTGEFSLRMLKEIKAGPARVDFFRPTLDEGEHLVLDIHSHGHFGAGFSPRDNRDDRGEVKISGVIGNCHEEEVTAKFRLCANGLFIPLPLWDESKKEVGDEIAHATF